MLKNSNPFNIQEFFTYYKIPTNISKDYNTTIFVNSPKSMYVRHVSGPLFDEEQFTTCSSMILKPILRNE